MPEVSLREQPDVIWGQQVVVQVVIFLQDVIKGFMLRKVCQQIRNVNNNSLSRVAYAYCAFTNIFKKQSVDGKQLHCIWRPSLNCFRGAGHSVQWLFQENSAEHKITSKSHFLVTWHLPWQRLLKTNKKGTVDKLLNSRLALDLICLTARIVGHTISNFPFLSYSCYKVLHTAYICLQIQTNDYFGSAKYLA